MKEITVAAVESVDSIGKYLYNTSVSE